VEELDIQSHGVIRLLLSHNVAFNISKENTNESLMEAFTIMYEKYSISNRCCATISRHLNEHNIITTQFSSVVNKF